MSRNCDNCKRDNQVAYTICEEYQGINIYLCSLECLMEWTWGIREKREKLSKSKVPPEFFPDLS